MLTQPRSSTNSTPPQSRYSTGRISRTTSSCSATATEWKPASFRIWRNCGNRSSLRALIGVDLLLRQRDVGARLQPADHLPVVAVPRVVGFLARRERGRHPDVDVLPEELEACGGSTPMIV